MQYVNYREKRVRGTKDFPLEYHHVSKNHPQYTMSLHWHVEYEIIRILKNDFTITIDEKTLTAKAGECLLIPPGSVHSGIPNDCLYECLVFDINMLVNKNEACKRIIKAISDHEVELPYLFTRSYRDINQIVDNTFDVTISKKEGYEMVVEGLLYQLFGTIFTEHYYEPLRDTEPKHHKRLLQLKTALEYIENSYQKAISLNDMAASVNMSPKYFCRFFHDMTNHTPVEYLNSYRIERASYQLLTTDQSITEIAYNNGFNDLSYFIKTFKKYKGITPKQYLIN
ncbi:MAG TPA: AraC family transcriptional regulator [Candidatus Dorea intestinavium]|nr:AraC family transcriptional regulator [Candidatus Dorea intestinavium]